MRLDKSNTHNAIIGFFVLAGIILIITLLALTTNREVSQSEYVVLYDTYNREFNGVKEQGRYTTGVGVKFFPFQRTLQDLSLGKVLCLSSDKIEIELRVKVQMRLREDSLIPLVLRQFSDKDHHRDFLKHIARSTLISSCLAYDVNDYFSSRSQVDRDMFENLQKSINDQDFGADVEFFQLVTIQLPEPLVEVITVKQNIEQELITATNDRTNELIQATTDFLEAEQVAEVTLIDANNTAKIITNQAEAQEEIIRSKWFNAGEAYSSVAENLNLDEKDFVEYLSAELYRLVNVSVVH